MGVLKIRGKWAIEWYGPDGKRRRKVGDHPGSFENSYEAAKRAYRDTRARLDRGDPPLFSASTKTVKEIAKKYLEVCGGTWAGEEAARRRIVFEAHLLPHFGRMKIGQVRRLHVEEYVAQRQREPARHRGTPPKEGRPVKLTAPATINKEVAILRHLLNKAIAWGEIARNPCQGVKRLKEPPEKVAYLDGDERGQLLDAAGAFSPTLQAIVTFAMLTGARLSEVLALTWGNVDLARRILTFRKTKSGRVRHVLIHADLARLLLIELGGPGDPAAPLFPPEWNSKRVSTAFRRLARKAGLNGFRFHDLRHDFGSWLSMRGVPIRAVQTLLGHRDLRMTERYTHLAERTLAAAIELLPALPRNGDGQGERAEAVPARVG